jgi:putative phosphoesterase
MLVIILGDVHANLPALQAVLKDIKKFGKVDYILHPGDLVGYGPNPNEVCELAAGLKNFISVLGNHDRAVLDKNYEGFNPVAREAIEWTAKELTKKNIDWIGKIPKFRALKLDFLNVFLVHGSPRNYLDEYVYPDTPPDTLLEFLRMTEAHVIVLGHTHIPFLREFGNKIILNVGSVGQPRDRDPRACYAVLDTEKLKISFVRVEYDIDQTARSIRVAGLPGSLADRLYYGW